MGVFGPKCGGSGWVKNCNKAIFISATSLPTQVSLKKKFITLSCTLDIVFCRMKDMLMRFRNRFSCFYLPNTCGKIPEELKGDISAGFIFIQDGIQRRHNNLLGFSNGSFFTLHVIRNDYCTCIIQIFFTIFFPRDHIFLYLLNV